MQARLNLLWSRLLFRHLSDHGLRFAAVAPGARNLPLLEALRQEPAIRSEPCIDERAAAYQALGWLKGRRALGADLEVAAVVCTSGSALLNLAPAIAEASAAGLPLLAISADRPPEDQDCGSNQTLDPGSLPAGLLRARRLLPLPDEALLARIPVWCRDSCRQALAGGGPVHLDQPFREPLLDADGGNPSGELPTLKPARPLCSSGSMLPFTGVDGLLSECRRGLVWASGLDHPQDREAALEMAGDLGWPLLADVTSGCLGAEGATVIRHGELLLDLLEQCDGVIQLGRRAVSRRLLEVLGSRVLLQVDDHPQLQDPAFSGALHLPAPPRRVRKLVEQFGKRPEQVPDWSSELAAADQRAEARIVSRLEAVEWCEAGICRELMSALPVDCGLLLGNSLPVRLADQFSPADMANLKTAANRGHSGIDGLLATACGFQLGLDVPAAVLIGDLSLAHDLSSLALLRDRSVLCVVQNNGGGAIFDLHSASRDRNWARFGVEMRFAELAAALEIEAIRVDALAPFRKAVRDWVREPGPLLIECMLPAGGHAGWLAGLAGAEA